MVTIERETYYTLDEINPMISSSKTTAANQWEVYEVSYNSGFSVGWDMCRMFVNKHTGAVTGILGMNNMAGNTNNTLLTNSNLGIHSGMNINFPGMMVYTTTSSTASDATKRSALLYNFRISTSGVFTGQGSGFTRSELATHIESFFYIGSKYGKITTEDVKPIYLPEGTFYNQNSVDLLTGKAWLKYEIPLDSKYYTEASSFTLYKNLWSAECIVQYNLYPTTADTWANISIPSRFMPYSNLTTFLKPRYMSPASASVRATEKCYAAFSTTSAGNSIFKFGNVPTGTARIAGSNFYIGNGENAQGLDTETIKGLWNRDASIQVPSAENTIFSNLRGSSIGYVSTKGMLVSGYKARADYNCYVARSRTGMVYFAGDMQVNGTTLANPIFNDFSQAWRPSYKYRRSTLASNATQTIYFASPAHVATGINDTPSTNSYTANICLRTNLTSGGDNASVKAPAYGSTGNISPTNGNTLIWQGWYIADNT